MFTYLTELRPNYFGGAPRVNYPKEYLHSLNMQAHHLLQPFLGTHQNKITVTSVTWAHLVKKLFSRITQWKETL